jgi:hypothetical protein
MSKTREVLWGFQPGSDPIQITAGTAAQCRREQDKRAKDGWVCTILPEGTEPGLLRDLAAAAASRFDDELGFTVITAGELADFRKHAESGFAWTCRTARQKGGTSWDRGKVVGACEIASADRGWYEQHQAFHERTGPELYDLAAARKPWAPPARRAYQPKPLDPGQPVTWTVPETSYYEQPGYVDEAGTYHGPAGYTEVPACTRTGTIWSAGPKGPTWWVTPDEDPGAAVVIRRMSDGQLVQEKWWANWRDEIRRAENVRRRGIYAVVTEVLQGGYSSWSSGPRPETKVLRWHADPDCPDAAGLERDDGEGTAYHRDGPGYSGPWNPTTAADVLVGRVSAGGTMPPFCKHCILLEPRPEETPASAGTVALAR